MNDQYVYAQCRAFVRRIQNREGAHTPQSRRAVIQQLRDDLRLEGRLPYGEGEMFTDPGEPEFLAALEGRPVARGGATVAAATSSGNLTSRFQALSRPAQLAVMVGVFLIPLLLAFLILTLDGDAAAAEVAATATALPSPTATATASPIPAMPLQAGIGTPWPTPTPTPYAISLTTGQAAPDGNDPASIEVGGFTYVLGVGRVVNGIWQPEGASWLEGSDLRRVVALPYEPALANAAATLRPGTVLKLRLRSGEIARYRLTETLRVQRTHIEVLAGRSPSLAVVLYGEPSGERTVLLASAIQEPQPFAPYSGGGEGDITSAAPLTDSLAAALPAVPTLVPTTSTVVVTSTRTVRNDAAGLELTVGTCRPVTRIGNSRAPEGRRFYTCAVTLEATGASGASFSDQALRIGERLSVESSLGWLPEAVQVPDALGAGTLSPGGTTEGQIGGLVFQGGLGAASNPVLVWEQAGTRYVILLSASDKE